MSRDSRSAAAAGTAEEFEQARPDTIGPGAEPLKQVPGDAQAGTVAARGTATADAGNGERPHESLPPTALSWLGEALVDGLVHCACSHQSVHPDLLPLVNGETPSATAPCPAASDGDSG